MHRLDVFLTDGQLTDVQLDGESQFPTWFKIEWKETGEVSAKIKGVRLATRFGDEITIHHSSESEALSEAEAELTESAASEGEAD